ncbi:hypothetical protein [Pseudomonas sp.]|jgi:hypothetical protein|uniref:hypothetical protein n=1 Tax=Pseudomonas sp. TaxID=306 RepID=UPI0026225EB4|nr:hypothetical protein [Pseudomonas sp.]
MEHPETGQIITSGRLVVVNGQGEFTYDPDYVASGNWVPDPIRYPLRRDIWSDQQGNSRAHPRLIWRWLSAARAAQ